MKIQDEKLGRFKFQFFGSTKRKNYNSPIKEIKMTIECTDVDLYKRTLAQNWGPQFSKILKADRPYRGPL